MRIRVPDDNKDTTIRQNTEHYKKNEINFDDNIDL